MEAERRDDQAVMQMRRDANWRESHGGGNWKIVPVETMRQERISLTHPFNFSFSLERAGNR